MIPTFTYDGKLDTSSIGDLKATEELDSSHLDDTSALESSAVEGEISMGGNSSSMAIDTDMDES